MRGFRQIVRTLHNRRWRNIPLTVLVTSFALVAVVGLAGVVTLRTGSSDKTELSTMSATEGLAAKDARSDDVAEPMTPDHTATPLAATKQGTRDSAAQEQEKAAEKRVTQKRATEQSEQVVASAAANKATEKKAATQEKATKAAEPKKAEPKAAEKTAATKKKATQRKAAEKKATKKKAEKKAAEQEAARKAAEQKAARQKSTPDWVLPIESYFLTGRFGQSGNRWASYHHGLDFAADSGTPIRAVGRGEIIAAGWEGAYGNRILVRHPDGTVTLYAHMSKFERTSGSVEPGTVIGYVGATGNVTGPHLHLEVRPNGGGLNSAIDPFAWLANKGLNP